MLSHNMNDTSFGRAALARLDVSPDFAIFYAGWVEEPPAERKTMRVTGAVFDKKERMVPGTMQSVIVTIEEIAKF